MSDSYEISAKISADDSNFEAAINRSIKGMEDFSANFSTMSDAAKSSFSSLANQFEAIDAKAQVWGKTIDVIGDKKAALRTEINKLIDGGLAPESKQISDLKLAYDQLGEGHKNLGDTFARLRDIMQGPIAAFQMLKEGLSKISDATVGAAARFQDMEAAFTPLVGGAENARKMIEALNKEAATTPFELEGIGNVAKQLLPVLGNDIGAVTSTFRMLGDTAGGSLEKLDSITRGYVKTMNTGKVSMEALNMISDAGVPIQAQLAQSMGVSVNQLYAMTSAGAVTSDKLTEAFKKMTSEGGLYFEGMKVASKTYNAELAGLSDGLTQAGAAIGNIFLPKLSEIVHSVATAAFNFADWAKSNDNLKKTFDILLPIVVSVGAAIAIFAITANISAIIGGVSGAISGLATAFRVLTVAIASNPIGAIAAGIALLIGGLIAAKNALGGWGNLWLEVQKISLEVLKAILGGLSWFVNKYIDYMNMFVSTYDKIATTLKLKPIELIPHVDLAGVLGLDKSIDGVTQKIDDAKKKAKDASDSAADGADKVQKKVVAVAVDYKEVYDVNSLYEDRIAKDTQDSVDKRDKAELDLAVSRERLYLETSDANSLYEDRIAKVTADTAEQTTKTTAIEEKKKKQLYLDNATTITSIIQSMASDISAIILGNTEDIAKNFAKMASDMATNIGKLFGPAGSAVGGIISGMISIGTAIADMFSKSKKDAEDAKKNMIAAELEYESAVLNAQKQMLDQQLKNEQARLAAQTSALDKEKNAALVAAGLTEDTRQQDLKDSIADINKQLLAETDAEKIKALQKQKIIDEFEIKKQNASDESAKKQAEIAYESAVVQQKIEIAKAKIDRESARLAAWAAHEGEGADAQQTAADASNALFDELISLLSTPIPTPAAEGAIVAPRSGGTLMQLGEGGKTEVVFPLDKLENFMTKGTIDYTAGYRMLGGLGADSVHLPSSRSSATGASAGSGRSSSTGTTIGNIIINSPKTNINDSVRIMKRQMQQVAFMGNI